MTSELTPSDRGQYLSLHKIYKRPNHRAIDEVHGVPSVENIEVLPHSRIARDTIRNMLDHIPVGQFREVEFVVRRRDRGDECSVADELEIRLS